MTWLAHVTTPQLRPIPECRPGDQVKVWCRIQEQDRVRLSAFEGLVIRRRGSGLSETITVRRVTYGEGVERVFPMHAPILERIDVVRRGKVQRSRLYYLRDKVGKTRIAAAAGESAKASASNEGSAASPAPSKSSEQPSAAAGAEHLTSA
ncbi:MAG: 50S ribosomal protein L19 [Candidatus Omnitrophica bacterium]|nr:50S ribosomal protein L19 [Candidatus Omnitrophota bacterium]